MPNPPGLKPVSLRAIIFSRFPPTISVHLVEVTVVPSLGTSKTLLRKWLVTIRTSMLKFLASI